MKTGSMIQIIMGCIFAVIGLLPLFLYGELIPNMAVMLGGILIDYNWNI